MTEQEEHRLTERVACVRRERWKRAEKAMEGVVSAAIAAGRQPVVSKVTHTEVITALHDQRSDDLAGATSGEEKRRQVRGRDGVSLVGASDVELLVELRGFEPLTPSMRTRCATGLRYSP